MAKIGPKNSKQEILIRRLVRSLGYKFVLHKKDLPGKPDIVFPKYRKVIFVNGCFWHGHKGCKRAKLPKKNFEFWQKKISGNVKKDKRDYKALNKKGWKYLVVWQCNVKKKNYDMLKTKLLRFLKK